MQLHISKDINELSKNFADWLVQYAAETLQKQDRFTIALSGGSTPKLLHKLLAGDDYKNKIDWGKWHFFMGDERFVPVTDERSNAKMCYETLLDHVPVNKDHIHFFQTENITPEESVKNYEEILHQYFDAKATGLDVIILGMGDDGHTLSLFPHQVEVIHEESKWTTSFWLEEQDMYRVTMTHPVANHAARVAFLAAGEKKQHALKEVLEGVYDPDLYPSQIIKPNPGELHWFVDEVATKLLSH
ncbi:MAG TPA: 6-phosphogluconolactonase [Arachidicoccus sp.]